MMEQTEEFGLRPSGTAGETTHETAQNPATPTEARGPADVVAGDPADVVAAGPGEAMADEATGEPRVDAALARLAELDELPVTEHRAVFEDVHRRLRDVLGELDTGQPRDGAAPRAQRAGQAPDNPW